MRKAYRLAALFGACAFFSSPTGKERSYEPILKRDAPAQTLMIGQPDRVYLDPFKGRIIGAPSVTQSLHFVGSGKITYYREALTDPNGNLIRSVEYGFKPEGFDEDFEMSPETVDRIQKKLEDLSR